LLLEATKLHAVEMEKKGLEIAASSADEGRQEQHAIDVARGEHGDGRGEDVEAVGKEKVAMAEEVQSKRVAALDAFRGLTIVVHTVYTHQSKSQL
jgi:heparan-alpha-glucosaminide N-acetyltransferase